MNAPKRLIEVDEQTAIALETRAAERGLSVPDLVAEMTSIATSQEALSTDEIAELDRRWAAIEAGEPTIQHDKVVRWLRTWGSPAFKSWSDR
jgi:predicted transcriptional regulator